MSEVYGALTAVLFLRRITHSLACSGQVQANGNLFHLMVAAT
jgi:hypothetical protein